jgi:radical SAM protein with 4Fe4S-binding SPASM domain
VSQVKDLKGNIIAGSAIKGFDFFIQWHLTERCNLRCSHCYQEGNRAKEMSLNEVRREIDGAAEMFEAWEQEHGIRVSPSVHFTGGEPFLYEELWEVLDYSKKKGFGTAIMTNGALVSKKNAKKVFDLGIFDIQVSLEGPPDLHDSIRGTKSFDAAARGIGYLVAAGNRVSANVTLTRLNVGKIEEVAEIARGLGAYGIGFSRMVPCGTGISLFRDLLTPQELKEAYQRIFSLNLPSFKVLSGDPLAGALLGEAPVTGCGLTLSGCSAGFSGVTIACDGSVMPCRRIGLVAGSLREKSLREIWASSKLLWRLRKRKNYQGKCGRCSLWPSCRGCRAVAYAYSSLRGRPDLFADDPQCWRPGEV